ncbi:hypothetical protein GCM10017786_50840 [Amycolatopsis deserti]|uniref:Secreted protein n=1 Tax=Amycolatopsis deserti TaxID=185696 RepID=A0ABQ3JEW0_9PSEU|nr:hypothetical protein [Amycolatopsis deserti]GHF10991.1 hypothetical protein GCM10017786_50840 [Amycolatopsis deserti]
MFSKFRKTTAAAVLVGAGLLAMGVSGGTASAATGAEPSGLTCPAQVPAYPTGADYVNAWNQSGACFGAGAAGLVSSAWAGAIPSIVQGAAGSVSGRDDSGLSAPVVVPSDPTGADYVNAWNESGALAGAGAAGLVSSAWAGAIPSIVQGALG